jgi:uncharacterized protein (TIGR00251 family)
MIDLAAHACGSVLRVKAQPGAKKNAVLGERAGALRVAVTAAPERGKANEAVVELLAKALKLPRARIALLTGETSRDKRFLIEDINPDDLKACLEAILGNPRPLDPAS